MQHRDNFILVIVFLPVEEKSLVPVHSMIIVLVESIELLIFYSLHTPLHLSTLSIYPLFLTPIDITVQWIKFIKFK